MTSSPAREMWIETEELQPIIQKYVVISREGDVDWNFSSWITSILYLMSSPAREMWIETLNGNILSSV